MKTFVLLLTLALLAITSAASATDTVVQPRIEAPSGLDRTEVLSVVAPVSFAGTWKTMAGGRYPYTVILKQVGDKVNGTYSPGNGKIFNGVVTDNKVRFEWTQDGGNEGTAEFIMNEGGKGFTGTSNALKPTAFTVPWNTYTPPVTSFVGTWETISNGKHHFQLTIVQTGSKVTGIYPRANGKLEGTVSGRVLRFKWESDGGSGSGRLVMDENEQAFNGTYNKGDNPDDVENTWNGTHQAVTANKAPGKVSFSGCWNLTGGLGGKTPDGTICLKQDDGGRVTSPEDSNFEGTVSGNTVRFTHRPTGDYRSGKFIMDEGGKSFHGFWHGGNDTELNENPGTGVVIPTPPTFAGVWHAKLGESALELILQQDGKQITGRANVNSANLGMIRNGIVDGNTLRFQIWRDRSTFPNVPDQYYAGSGELVMNADGKSFRGTILDGATSGTLIAR